MPLWEPRPKKNSRRCPADGPGGCDAQVGNQDHSLMLGVECADNVLFGTKVCPAGAVAAHVHTLH